MRKVVLIIQVILLIILLAGCAKEKPQAMNAEEKRLYDSLMLLLAHTPDMSELRLQGIDTEYKPEHLNIDVQITFRQNGVGKLLTTRLMFSTGTILQDTHGYYAKLADRNTFMKILNVNHALEEREKQTPVK